MRSACIFALLSFLSLSLCAVPLLSIENIGKSRPSSLEVSSDPEFYTEDWLVYDVDADGTTDYALLLDANGKKLIEAIDFDKNGFMDDFYYYSDNIFTRQEIDQNEDGNIDIWVYLIEGVYIRGFEEDEDFDGIIDRVEIFNEDFDPSESDEE